MSVRFNIASYADHRTPDLKARYELIEIARVPQIEVRPVQRPIYCNRNIADYGRWAEQNLQTLLNYWNQLLSADGAGPLGEDDVFVFCVVQWESERERMEELRRCYKNYGDNR